MKELLSSFITHLGSRAKSQLYGTFGLWWIVFHWSFFFSLFFLDQNLILKQTGLLKDQYLMRNYFDYHSRLFWLQFGMPFLMTYFTIRWLPSTLLLWSYKREKKDEYGRKVVKLTHDREVEDLKLQLEEKKIANLDKAEKRVEKQKKIDNMESKEWQREYRQFKQSNFFREFTYILESIYEHRGHIKDNWSSDRGHYEFETPTSILTFAHANELVEFEKTQDAEVGVIQLTRKGKFFAKQYSLETTISL